MSKQKLLITGSGGFIFSNFVRFLLKNSNDYEVVSVDNCSVSGSMNTIYSNKGHKFHIGDIADEKFINTIFEIEKPDFVIHGAACSFVDAAFSNPSEFVRSNVLGTQVIINACVKFDIKKLVYMSTDEVHGQLETTEELSWTEESPLNPRNAYSASKASGELLVKAANQVHGLKYNIARSCNNYGPRQPRRNLIPVIISNIMERKQVPIYGSGNNYREFIHVQSTCSALLTILEKGLDNETYNISSGQEYSNLEVFNIIANAFHENFGISNAYDLLKFVPDRPGHDFRYSLNSNKLRELGWSPQFKFKDGINHTIHWYLNNKWFIK